MRAAVFALAALSAALPAHAQPLPVEVAALPDTKRLTPSSPWNLDAGENKCRLQRIFESEGKPHALIIEQSAPGASFSLVMAGPALMRLKGTKQLAIGLTADRPLETDRSILSGKLGDYGAAFVVSSFSLTRLTPGQQVPEAGLRRAGIDLDQANKVNRIVLGNAKGKQAVSFETGNMRDGLAALNSCTADMLVQWGLDPELHRDYRRPVLLNDRELRDYFFRTYPDEALAKDEGGLFTLRLIVEADGSVSSCHVEANSNVTELDPRCDEIIKRARIEPARDAQGKAMRSFFITKLTYLTG